ncbi:MAG: DUF262 domain-containing protein [Bacteroidales bacterium]|nr:DUF262 domain-containing protein [Bacteroidales bacterium]
MPENQFNNKRYSFFQLFTQGTKDHPGDYQLVIPIIQRDYAQGRGNDKAREVRADFLQQLLEYMSAPSGSHDLDFVYGVSEHAKDPTGRREFVPLDGQQRLTTLFLIHWYLTQRVLHSEPSNRFLTAMRDVSSDNLTLSMFTYRTRRSAAEFCDCLLNPQVDYSSLLRGEYYPQRLSQSITNSHWFYPEWQQDPTVASMLTMLDAIDKKFRDQDHEAILSRLLSDEEPAVTFIFMDLDEFKLTDDLYIKMNSRGKPLTSFENFKAKFEQYISQRQKAGDPALVELNQEIASRNDPIITDAKSNFAFKIDTSWADLFWQYSKDEIKTAQEQATIEKANGNTLNSLLSTTLDVKLSNFIKMCLTNQFAIDHRDDKGRTKIPDILDDPAKELSFTRLEDTNAISAQGVVYLTRMFDQYSKGPLSILPKWASRYYDEQGAFEAMMRGDKKFGYVARFRMYAISRFRLEFGDNAKPQLVEWMRFVYNVTHADNTIEDITGINYIRAVKNLDLLLDLLSKRQDPSIVNLLASADCPENIEFFPTFQVTEEIIKSHLRLKGVKWNALIDALERHPYFTGQIGGLLDLAGITSYFKNHRDTNWTAQEDLDYWIALRRIGKIASRLFKGGYDDRQLASTALLERAMMTLHPSYDSVLPLRPNLLNSLRKRAGSNNILRDMSWKAGLRQFDERPKALEFVKDLFDLIDPNHVEDSLQKIIDCHKTGSQWVRDMVTYPYLMNKCPNGFMYHLEDGHRILKSHINLHQEDHEVYSLVLWWEYIHPILSDESWYKNSNANDEIPHACLVATNEETEIKIKVKSRVNPVDGDLLSHFLEVKVMESPKIADFFANEGFYRRKPSDTWLRSQEHYMTYPRETSPQEQRAAISGLRTAFARYCQDLIHRLQTL